jgi:hypothetical protein
MPTNELPDDETPPLRRWLTRFARRLAATLIALVCVLLLAPLGLLTILGETRAGRLVGWLALTTIAALICGAALAWPVARWRAWSLALATCLIAAGVLAVAVARVPTPALIERETGLRSVVLGPAELMRPGPLGRLPERDLVKLGAAMGSRLIPGIDAGHSRRIREETTRLYRELDADEVGKTLPTVAHLALAELIGRPFDAGHYYAYVPAHAPGERLGAIVFLHGNAGNLKLMTWAWRPFAEAHRFAIICPTYGFGLWGEAGVRAVNRTLDDALRRLPIDPGRVYLAGVSDGGNGVTRAGRDRPSRFRGLLYMSPTMRVDELESPAYSGGWRGRQVLVLHGDRDVNVRKADVDPAVDRLRALGVDVTYRVFPGEDHFLFFGRSAEVFETISAWMNGPREPARGLPPVGRD